MELTATAAIDSIIVSYHWMLVFFFVEKWRNFLSNSAFNWHNFFFFFNFALILFSFAVHVRNIIRQTNKNTTQSVGYWAFFFFLFNLTKKFHRLVAIKSELVFTHFKYVSLSVFLQYFYFWLKFFEIKWCNVHFIIKWIQIILECGIKFCIKNKNFALFLMKYPVNQIFEIKSLKITIFN